MKRIIGVLYRTARVTKTKRAIIFPSLQQSVDIAIILHIHYLLLYYLLLHYLLLHYVLNVLIHLIRKKLNCLYSPSN